MNYICKVCGNVVTEEELNNSMDSETGEREDYCTNCHNYNTFEEAVECPICGDYMPESSVICNNCDDNDDEIAFVVRELNKNNRKINEFLTENLSYEEINEVLSNYFFKKYNEEKEKSLKKDDVIYKKVINDYKDNAKEFIKSEEV